MAYKSVINRFAKLHFNHFIMGESTQKAQEIISKQIFHAVICSNEVSRNLINHSFQYIPVNSVKQNQSFTIIILTETESSFNDDVLTRLSVCAL